MNYRLLNEGEVIEQGDEFFSSPDWTSVHGSVGELMPLGRCIRRPIETPASQWKPITPQTKLPAVLGCWLGNKWVSEHYVPEQIVDGSDAKASGWTHWLPLPKPPARLSEAEEAFNKKWPDREKETSWNKHHALMFFTDGYNAAKQNKPPKA